MIVIGIDPGLTGALAQLDPKGGYRACLDIALKLRAAIGEDGLAKLREAAQDY